MWESFIYLSVSVGALFSLRAVPLYMSQFNFIGVCEIDEQRLSLIYIQEHE